MDIQDAMQIFNLKEDDLSRLSADGIRNLIRENSVTLRHCSKADEEKLELENEALKLLLVKANNH